MAYMLAVRDICEPGLVLAMDFKEQPGKTASEGEEARRTWEESVLNILEANDFDAIPLVSEPQGYPNRVARRRYHDGDLSDLFVLDIEEVEVFAPHGSIIDLVFSVLSNEHHIALVGLKGSLRSIVTLDTLASPNSKSPILRNYLDQKVADVASSTGRDLPADLGRRAFAGIRSLASLIDGDRKIVSDGEFTQMGNDVLALLQPLKEHSETEIDKEKSLLWRTSRPLEGGSGNVCASDFVRPYMTGVLVEGQRLVTESARDNLSAANDFSNILIFKRTKDSMKRVTGIFRKQKGGWTREKPDVVKARTPMKEVLRHLVKADYAKNNSGLHPLVVVGMGEGTFGIITEEELCSEVPVFWIMKNLSVIEKKCVDWMHSQGIERISSKGYNHRIKVKKAGLGQLLNTAPFRQVKEALGGENQINTLANFRNRIVHEIIPDLEGDSALSLRGISLMLTAEDEINRIVG
jgi:hypothetical protein